ILLFFFSSRRRHTRFSRDWSSDVCSSDLEAGLYAYNHNLDSSEEYYKEVISTRGYQDRLDTIENVRKTNVTVCSGGIIGMGESIEDRAGMLVALSTLNPQPESTPINALVAVEGTPLE